MRPIMCRVCGLRLQDSGENIEEKEVGGRIARFAEYEEVCSCVWKPPIHPFTSRPQPPNLDTYDRKK
jgi:hypothetical protein